MSSPATAPAAAADPFRNVEFCAALPGPYRRALLGACELLSVAAGAQLSGAARAQRRAMHIILSGKGQLVDDRNQERPIVLDTLAHGAILGERSLFRDAATSYSLHALSDLVLLQLTRDSLDTFLREHPDASRLLDQYFSQQAVRNFLRHSAVFAALAPEELELLVGSLTHRRLAAGEYLIREGDPAGDVYLIEDGRLRVVKNEAPRQSLAVLRSNDIVGEMAALQDAPRNANVIAEGDAAVYVVPRQVFLGVVGRQKEFADSVRRLARERGGTLEVAETAATREGAAAEEATQRHLPWRETPAAVPGRLRYRLGSLPAVRQRAEEEAGAACLASILRYYGKRAGVEQLRELMGARQGPASAEKIARTARVVCCEAFIVRADYDHLSHNHLPAIVAWKGFHWVVVYRVSGEHVVVADPAVGLLRLSRDEFLAGWTGLTVYVRPTARMAQVPEPPTALARLAGLARPYRRLLFEIGLGSFPLFVFSVALPLFARFIIDDVIIRRESRWLATALAAAGLAGLLEFAVRLFRQHLWFFAASRMNIGLLREFYARVLSLPLSFFESRKVGEVTSYFEESGELTQFAARAAPALAIEPLTVMACLGLMLHYSPRVMLAALSFVVVRGLIVLGMAPMREQSFASSLQEQTAGQAHTIESIGGLKTIKVLGVERFIRQRWEELFARSANARFRVLKLGLVSAVGGQFVAGASVLAVLFYGALLVLSGRLTVGELVALTILARLLMASLERLACGWHSAQQAASVLERLDDVCIATERNEAAPGGRIELSQVLGHVRMEAVSFRYDEEGPEVLRDITLEVKPGQHVALVGRSGSGKSTLAKLLLGFYPPDSGRIWIDSVEVRDIWPPSLRRQVAAVPQEFFLFHGTIRQNISQARSGASIADVIRAASIAGAHEFITALPQGYETVLEEQGANLSGGQRQRLAIARAILQDARMLVLDEATSAIDHESERAFLQNLEEAFRGRTVFLLVAHRLSTVRGADLILVLDEGRIVESGTHDELMAKRGQYYLLNTQQLDL